MINTFKPFWRWYKPSLKCHDWFGIHFYICNYIWFSLTIKGYGFACGIKIFDVLKKLGEEEK